MKNHVFFGAAVLAILSGCHNRKASYSAIPSIKRNAMDFLKNGPLSFPSFFSLNTVNNLINKGKLKEASRYVNEAINTEPRNPALHLLNAFIYESMLKNGSNDYKELIDVAYRTAMDLDRTLWLTHYLRGLTAIKLGQYEKAQTYFTDALTLRNNDPEIIYALAYASYYAYDLSVALTFIEKAVKLCPKQAPVVRAATMIAAAAGSDSKAKRYFESYKNIVSAQEPDLKILKIRLEEWRNAHKRVMLMGSTDEEAFGLRQNSDYSNFDAKKTQAATTTPASSETVVFDVTLLNSVDQKSETKGQNIFNSLQVTLGGHGGGTSNGISASPQFNIARESGTIMSDGGSKSGSANATILAYGITPFALQYNLNIANATRYTTDILSRTSLSTTVGSPAYFLQGSQYTGATSGTLTGASTASVDAGIKIEINPLSLSETGEIVLEITLAGSDFINAPNPSAGISNQLVQAQRTKVSTTIKAFLGQTIMIAGIQTRQKSKSKSGFPFLQSIPIIQYFTAQASSTESTTSAMFLMTPRLGGFSNSKKRMAARGSIAKELRKRGLMSIGEYSNAYYIIKTILNAAIFSQFKSGDLPSPTFNHDRKNLNKKIEEITSFLWY